jgi:DNA-directed RNA polymerase subunit RPC12/RpoP
MNIENEKLKVVCPHCQRKIILTFHTTKCPKCNNAYNPDEVKQVFYNYESNLANSKLNNVAESAKEVADGMEKTGGALVNLGCFLFLLPLGILCFVLLMSMF